MKTPADWWQQRHARQRYMPRTHVRRGVGTTPKVAVAVLILIGLVLTGLELRDGGGQHTELAAWVESRAEPPVELVAAAVRSHRLTFLTDIPGAAGPKELTAAVLELAAADRGLDVLAVQVDPRLQPRIDRYLLSDPENAAILLGDPALAREASSASHAWVELFRRVHAVNREQGAARAIRILALDREGWPPGPGTGPHEMARAFASRDSAMLAVLEREVLARDVRARVLFLVDGLHALGGGGVAVQTGGTDRQRARGLPLMLRERFPAEVWVGLVDANAAGGGSSAVATYLGTALPGALRDAGLRPPLAVPLNDRFSAFTPGLRLRTTPGMTVELDPPGMSLPERGDAWIWLGG